MSSAQGGYIGDEFDGFDADADRFDADTDRFDIDTDGKMGWKMAG